MLIGNVCIIGYLFSVSCQWRPWKNGNYSRKNKAKCRSRDVWMVFRTSRKWDYKKNKALGDCSAGMALQTCRQLLDRSIQRLWMVCKLMCFCLQQSWGLGGASPSQMICLVSVPMPECLSVASPRVWGFCMGQALTGELFYLVQGNHLLTNLIKTSFAKRLCWSLYSFSFFPEQMTALD